MLSKDLVLMLNDIIQKIQFAGFAMEALRHHCIFHGYFGCASMLGKEARERWMLASRVAGILEVTGQMVILRDLQQPGHSPQSITELFEICVGYDDEVLSLMATVIKKAEEEKEYDVCLWLSEIMSVLRKERYEIYKKHQQVIKIANDDSALMGFDKSLYDEYGGIKCLHCCCGKVH